MVKPIITNKIGVIVDSFQVGVKEVAQGKRSRG